FQEVSYSYNAMRELYYVHVMKTYRKEEAHNWSVYLKKQKGFPDAWVFAYEVPNGMPSEAPTDGSGRRTARFKRSDETLLHCGLFAEANVPATTSSAPVIVSAAGGKKYLSYNHRQVTAE